MNTFAQNRNLMVLCALLGLTALSWLCLNVFKLEPEVLIPLLVIIAFIKARMVIVEFMELRKTSKIIQMLFEAWVIVSCTGILAISLMPLN